MTRINLILPSDLTDQHLVAEYREIFMVGPALQRSLKSKKWDDKRIPKMFTLDKGHVMFFYDKGKYLFNRYQTLREEMIDRGMNPDPKRKFPLNHFPPQYRNDWIPSERDKQIVKDRIALRISQKPQWYRYRGERI